MSIAANTTNVAGVVTLQDEANTCTVLTTPSPYFGISGEDGVDDVKRYLARPFNRSRGTITSGVGNLLSINYDSQGDWKNHVSATAWNRLRGALGLRATLVFRIVVTATPFHQGILAMSFQYGVPGASNNGRRGLFHFLAPNLPHVKLDISENTSAELRIPFVFMHEYMPIDDNILGTATSLGYGHFAVNKLTDFRVIVGQSAPTYTLYTSLEDVEVIGACPINVGSISLQAGTVSEREAATAGVVSGTLGLVSKAVAGFSDTINKVSTLGKDTAWYLSSLAKTAASFGWSRPTDSSPYQRITVNDYRYDSQVDVPTPALIAGPFQTNTLAMSGAVGCTDEDHMSFDKVLSVPSMIYRRSISTANNVNDYFYGCKLSPSCMWYREAGLGNIPAPAFATATTSCFAPSTIMYLANNFHYWRGGFKFTVYFSKSKLHGGRVLLSYTPDHSYVLNGSDGASVAVADTSDGAELDHHCKMFDLRDGGVVEFEIPYMSPDPYVGFSENIGTFAMSLISPLNAPAGASDTIDFAVFVSALPGFEMAGLTAATLDGTHVQSNQATGGYSGVYLQAGGASTTSDTSQQVVGEVFRSTKQLAMVPDYLSSDITNLSDNEVTLFHWFKRPTIPNLSGNVPIPDASRVIFFASKCGRVAELFAFANGSTDWGMITDTPDPKGTVLTVYTSGNDAGRQVTGVASLYDRDANRDSGFIMHESRGSARVRVPAYTRYYRLPVQRFAFDAGTVNMTTMARLDYQATFALHITNARVRNTSGSTFRMVFYRAAGDDATASHFVGPPLCSLFQSTRTLPVNATPNGFPF